MKNFIKVGRANKPATKTVTQREVSPVKTCRKRVLNDDQMLEVTVANNKRTEKSDANQKAQRLVVKPERGINNNAKPVEAPRNEGTRKVGAVSQDEKSKNSTLGKSNQTVESDVNKEYLDMDKELDCDENAGDNVLIDVNAHDNEHEFLTDEEEFKTEDELLEPRNHDTPVQEGKGHLPHSLEPGVVNNPGMSINDVIGMPITNIMNRERDISNVDYEVISCDSKINFRLPANHGRVVSSNVSAAEMLEQMKREGPGFMLLMNYFVDKRLEQATKNNEEQQPNEATHGRVNSDKRENKDSEGVNVNVMGLTNTPTGRKHDDQVMRILNKSPSDMTIYAPGLNLIQKDSDNAGKGNSPINVIDQISNFVERIRIETATLIKA